MNSHLFIIILSLVVLISLYMLLKMLVFPMILISLFTFKNKLKIKPLCSVRVIIIKIEMKINFKL